MSLCDNLAAYFRRHPSKWIDGRQLSSVAGGYAWRSRVSDLRLFHGMTIENRQRRMTNGLGSKFTVSEYRYVPSEVPHAEAS